MSAVATRGTRRRGHPGADHVRTSIDRPVVAKDGAPRVIGCAGAPVEGMTHLAWTRLSTTSIALLPAADLIAPARVQRALCQLSAVALVGTPPAPWPCERAQPAHARRSPRALAARLSAARCGDTAAVSRPSETAPTGAGPPTPRRSRPGRPSRHARAG